MSVAKEGVKFIRIRGRIVPIRSGGSHKAAKATLNITKLFVKGVQKTAGFAYRVNKKMPKGLVSVAVGGGLLLNQLSRPKDNIPQQQQYNGGY